MSVYLITGAAGFIGSNYVHFVLEEDPGATIVGVDYFGFASNPANLASIADRIEMVNADIADSKTMLELYRDHRPDYVVNFAAESHNDRAIIDPSGFSWSNALGAQVILECSRTVPVARHLHVSTIEVYGELPPDQDHFCESSPLNAKTPYSAAKAAGDQVVRAYMHTYPEMQVRLTHCANNYGPFQMPEKLIPLMISNVLRGRKVPVYGDGLQRRDWLHVQDHCRAIHAVLHAPPQVVPPAAAVRPALLPIYDISARHEVTNMQIVTKVLEALGVSADDWVEHVPDRPNHDRRYLIDPSKIETELGWKPRIPFEQGLAETVSWYVENEAWWREIVERKGELQFTWGRS